MAPSSETLLTWGTGGLSIGLGLYAARLLGSGARWLIVYFTGRVDTREAHIDHATNLLIERLQNEVKRLLDHKDMVDAKLRECLERDIEKERRIAQLEATLLGMGHARQHAQLIVSAEKAKDKR